MPDKWRFRVVDLDANYKEKRNFAHVERAYDGQDQYRIYHFSERLIAEQKTEVGKNMDLKQEHAEVLAGNFPTDANQHEKLIWLAFLSDITHMNPDLRYLPLLTRPSTFGSISVPIEMSRTRLEFQPLNHEDHLPSVLSGWAIPYIMRGISDSESRLEFMRFPPPYDEETLTLRYEVNSMESTAGQMIPTSFTCEFYFLTKTDQLGQFFTNTIQEVRRRSFLDRTGFRQLLFSCSYPEFL